jgi:WD40 repeat protein
MRTIPAATNGVTALAISPDLRTLASAGDRDEQVIKLWNLADGSLVQTLAGHTNGTGLLAFSPDGAVLASGGQFNDGSVMLWNVSNSIPTPLSGHAGGLRSLAFNATGSLLASAGRKDNLVKVWQTNGKTLVCSLTNLSRGARSVAFYPSGALLAACGTDRIQFWQTSDWQPCWSYTNETFRINALAFSPNGSFFIFGREDGTVGRFWNPQASPVELTLSTTTSAGEFSIHNPAYSSFLSVEISPDLQSWTTLTNIVAATNQVQVTDLDAAGVPIRFYRVSTPD